MGASKTPSIGVAEAITTESRNKCGLRLLLKYIYSVLLRLLKTVGICGPQRCVTQICSIYEHD